MNPQRIQRKRTKGWRMPEGAVYVGRPTRWGSPFHVVPVHRSGPFEVLHGDWLIGQHTGIESALRSAVERYRLAIQLGWSDVPHPDQIRAELAGKDLACWCRPNLPCHADVLLELANGAAS